MGYRIINGKLQLIENFPQSISQTNSNKSAKSNSFSDVLNKEISKNSGFTVSKHAAERLSERNVKLNDEDMKRINEGINKAQDKDLKECVILYKDTAFVTSIKNRTVITVMTKNDSKGNVFTNIDGMVML